MRRYRHINKYAAAFVLICFLTALTGVSALAGHDCCGNCAEDMVPNPGDQQPVIVGDGCCPAEIPVETTCACTFQATGDQTPQAYALTHVVTTGDDQQIQDGIIVSARDGQHRPPGSGSRHSHLEIRPRPGPIYLANQSFLC